MAHRAASPVTRARSTAAAPARRIRTDAVAADVLELLALGDDPDLEVVLQRILQAARRLVGARYAALGVPDGRGGFARFVTSGISEKRAAQIGDLPRTHGVLGVLLEEGPILLADIRKHPRFGYYPTHHPEMTDFLGVPITHRGEVLGNLFASGHRSARFSKQDQRALETLAAYAGVAIANADLYTRAQQLAVIEERNRVVRELHDAATQSLFSLVFAARAAALSTRDETARAALQGFEQRTSAALQELRQLVHALRPKSLERDGLPSTLTDHADALRRGGADVQVDVDPVARLSLDEEHALEALNNAMRHAPGAAVQVSLRRTGNATVLRIRDEGQGFDPGALRRTRRSLGMSTMRERAAQIGARLEVQSEPGTGTTVIVRLPTRKSAA
jgi:signal transduction histidine kinase